MTRKRALFIAACLGGALIYMLMPSCAVLVDADDTLCHALADAKGGVVDWPVGERWYEDPKGGCHVFDNVMMNPWWADPDARTYLDGFGLAQGHNWGDMQREDPTAYDEKTYEFNTPLGRTYDGYSNIVYANPEGIGLDRGRSLGDFEYYDTFLKWASAYVAKKTYRVNGSCFRSCQTVGSYTCAIARTVSGAFRNDYMDLYQTFYYEIDAVWRASTIVHEVRHARDEVLHTGGNGCPRRSACDRKWSNSSSNTYEMLWLAAYYWTPEDHAFITPARRARAQALFETLRQSAFIDPVKWDLQSLALINEIPEFYVYEAACSEDPDKPHRCLVLAN
ncbi:MAG: hypothetical protein JSU89_06295 [Myxococcales bacterium]|nr:MAG: hypothetical protein JSU89_06295 [Myxococcales bacterium]